MFAHLFTQFTQLLFCVYSVNQVLLSKFIRHSILQYYSAFIHEVHFNVSNEIWRKCLKFASTNSIRYNNEVDNMWNVFTFRAFWNSSDSLKFFFSLDLKNNLYYIALCDRKYIDWILDDDWEIEMETVTPTSHSHSPDGFARIDRLMKL